MAVTGDLDSGTVVGGYRIDDLISRGGMGVVYRATNVALNRVYALKVLAPQLAEGAEFRERFKRETRIAASLHHPNIVGIHYAGDHEGLLFFVMDYVTGTDLRQVVVKSGPLDPERAVDLLQQLASALDAAHSRGLIHRDVKPANVLITVKDGEERAYLTDFGLAKRSDAASVLTAKGMIVGTVDYMAPEQITGTHVDARTDIYALGCVFFQMLSGKVPYERENSVATLFAHVNDPPPPLEGGIVDRYPEFTPVLEKAMAKDQGDRYFSAGDFARDAAAALAGMRYDGQPTIVARGEATLAGVGPAAATSIDLPVEPPQPSAAPDTRISDQPPPVEAPPPLKAPPPVEALEPAGATLSSGGKPHREPVGAGGSRRRGILRAVGAVAVICGVVAAVIVLSSGSDGGGGSSSASGQPFKAAAKPVPTNRVTGTGSSSLALDGNTATVAVDTQGLLNGAAHPLHIHAGGKGVCPTASAASLHRGRLSIDTHAGAAFYGPAVVALTTSGDISDKSKIAFARFPKDGNIRYKRTITVPDGVAGAIRAENAVIVVHGIDYNGNGIYDNVLDRSDVDRSLPGEATAPALCGLLQKTTSATASAPGSTGSSYTIAWQREVAGDAAPTSGLGWLCHLPPVAAASDGNRL